jgi:hypothetical protein
VPQPTDPYHAPNLQLEKTLTTDPVRRDEINQIQILQKSTRPVADDEPDFQLVPPPGDGDLDPFPDAGGLDALMETAREAADFLRDLLPRDGERARAYELRKRVLEILCDEGDEGAPLIMLYAACSATVDGLDLDQRLLAVLDALRRETLVYSRGDTFFINPEPDYVQSGRLRRKRFELAVGALDLRAPDLRNVYDREPQAAFDSWVARPSSGKAGRERADHDDAFWTQLAKSELDELDRPYIWKLGACDEDDAEEIPF